MKKNIAIFGLFTFLFTSSCIFGSKAYSKEINVFHTKMEFGSLISAFVTNPYGALKFNTVTKKYKWIFGNHSTEKYLSQMEDWTKMTDRTEFVPAIQKRLSSLPLIMVKCLSFDIISRSEFEIEYKVAILEDFTSEDNTYRIVHLRTSIDGDYVENRVIKSGFPNEFFTQINFRISVGLFPLRARVRNVDFYKESFLIEKIYVDRLPRKRL